MIVAGIDYSLTSPAITIINESKIDFHFFVSSEKKLDLIKHDSFHPTLMPKSHSSQNERYRFLSQWCLDILKSHHVSRLALEDYSFGSKGSSLFQIAENGGILKYVLDENGFCDILLIAPTQVKKFATGKGNADKALMEKAFIEKETNFSNIRDVLHQTEKQITPSSDIIDSYFIARYLLHEHNEHLRKSKTLSYENS
jgi:Holliday junction resolvasome RuvABC endonuclease subunit